MKITRIDCHVLVDPGYDPTSTSSAQDDLVVEVYTDDGLVGIGESDVNPWIGRACIEAPGTQTMDLGLGRTLIGKDPTKPEDVWAEMYRATAMPGRRGALISAMGALDMALWDLRGKAAGVPVWKLLGERIREAIPAYASLQPEVADFQGYRASMLAWAHRMVQLGFPAVKIEATFSGPYATMGLRESDERMTELVRDVRAMLGPNIALMVDVQYAFDNAERARQVLSDWEAFDLFFVETPLWIDDLDGYAELAASTPIRLAAGEWQTTHYEFRDLIEHGGIAVVQPDVGRVGGVSEARKVCQLAAIHGRLVVPHAWKTGITLAATAHLATVTPHMPYFEFLHADACESRLRKELVADEIVIGPDGVTVPERPGLGIELNREALNEFSEAAERLYKDER